MGAGELRVDPEAVERAVRGLAEIRAAVDDIAAFAARDALAVLDETDPAVRAARARFAAITAGFGDRLDAAKKACAEKLAANRRPLPPQPPPRGPAAAGRSRTTRRTPVSSRSAG